MSGGCYQTFAGQKDGGGGLRPEWQVDFKRFPESKLTSLPVLLLAGPPLQIPARNNG